MADLFGSFDSVLDKAGQLFTNYNDYKLAQAQIAAETQPTQTVVVSAPNDTASAADSKPNTLLLAGVGVGAVALLVLAVAIIRK